MRNGRDKAYILYIRSILEVSAVVWHSSLTLEDETALGRVQKTALKIILSDQYDGYEMALEKTGLATLKERRVDLCLSFAKKCTQNPKTADMFPLRQSNVNTRNPEKYFVTPASTDRLAKSAIPYMQRLLNEK